ncbi:hypothetical protein Tco_0304346 [Tanacetum coccineum]
MTRRGGDGFEVQLALLTLRTRKFFQKTSRKITINGSDTTGYDKSKEQNQDSSRRTINVEEISSKAMLAIDGAGFDWSFMADEEVPIDMALMAFSDSEINFVRPQQQEKPVRKPIKYAEMYRSQTPRGNQRNWNNQKSQQLGSDFMIYNKACFVSGSFDHVQANCNCHQRERMVYGNNYTRVNYNYSTKKAHPCAHRNIVPRAVLMKTGLRPLNTVRPVNIAHPKNTVYSARPVSCFSKSAQSTVKRPYQIRTALTNKKFCQKVNTAKGKVNTARPKAVNTARPNTAVVNAGHPQKEDQVYVNSGCSRHMIGNMSCLSNFKEFNGRYVTFGGGAKGGRIIGKEILKTGKLDFKDVYFVKEI